MGNRATKSAPEAGVPSLSPVPANEPGPRLRTDTLFDHAKRGNGLPEMECNR